MGGVRSMGVVVVLGLAVAGCGPAKPQNTVRLSLGAVIDSSGSLATPSWGQALGVAAADANAGLLTAKSPVRFDFVVKDSTNSPTVSTQTALELATSGVKAVITDSSQDDIAVNSMAYDADAANDLGVPVVCIACTSPAINNPAATNANAVTQAALRNGQGWNFRTVMNATLQARVLVKIALGAGINGDVNGDGQFKMGIYASDEAFGRGFSDALKAAVLELHPSPAPIVEQLFHGATVPVATYDWAADMTKLTDDKTEPSPTADGLPDVIVEVTFPQFTAAVVKAYVDSGKTVRFLHTHTFRFNTVIQALGFAIDKHEGTSHVLLDGTSGATFADRFVTATGAQPSFWDSNAYDAGALLMLATMLAAKDLPDPAQVTGAAVRDALLQVNDPAGEVVGAGPDGFARAAALIAAGKPFNYEGASGPCDFKAGDVINRLVHFKVQTNQFIDVEKFDCVSDPSCPLMQ